MRRNNKKEKTNQIIIIVALIIFLTMGAITYFVYTYRIFQVRGNAMAETLTDGKYVIVRTRNINPKTGDVVVYTPPGQNVAQYISRVVATDGEYILGEQISSGEYFIVGDNLNNSLDSRNFGPITHNAIVGILVWPQTSYVLYSPETVGQKADSDKAVAEQIISELESRFPLAGSYEFTKEQVDGTSTTTWKILMNVKDDNTYTGTYKRSLYSKHDGIVITNNIKFNFSGEFNLNSYVSTTRGEYTIYSTTNQKLKYGDGTNSTTLDYLFYFERDAENNLDLEAHMGKITYNHKLTRVSDD